MTEEVQRVKELLLLQRVAQKINTILEPDKLLEEVVGDVAETFGYTRSGILLKDDETNELEIAAVRGWTINYHMKGERFKIGEYGMVGHVGLTEETYYSPDVTKDPYYQISEESTLSELDIPLKVRGRLIGVFNFQHQDKDAFSPDRIKLLESLAVHVSAAIENARLFENERQEKARMAQELNEARSVQLSLFPSWKPAIQGLEISGVCIPCLEVGGDWYDYIDIEGKGCGIVVADVSGKGPGAALLMASTRSIVRMYTEKGLPPGEILRNVNRTLINDFPKTRFVTMLMAVISSGGRKAVIANAGHPPPVIMDSEGIRFLSIEPGFPLGIMESEYFESEVEITPGSRILFYSDGISEAMNSTGEEYGDGSLLEHLNNSQADVESVLQSVKAFISPAPPADDMTLVMIKSTR